MRGLGLKSGTEWIEYCKSGKKPADIPNAPQSVYSNDGWSGIDDWLGTGKLAPRLQYRSFKKARAFVHGLGLKSGAEWKEYCKSGKKPADIPAKPDNGYANDGWAGMGDWLGTGKVAPGQYRSFKKVRAFVRGLPPANGPQAAGRSLSSQRHSGCIAAAGGIPEPSLLRAEEVIK
jgi:hypothetical protein